MKFAEQWSSLICLSSAVCVIISLILPSGKMEKSLRIVLGVFLIACIISPLSDGIPRFKIKSAYFEKTPTQATNFMKSLDEQFKSLAEQNLTNIVKQTLKKFNVENENIELSMDTNSDECISINKCIIYLNHQTKKGQNSSQLTQAEILKIKKELEKRLNIETEVIVMN